MTNLVAYTWAKSIDLSSERGNGDRGGGFSGSGDERNRAGSSRGLSGFDVRHRLVVSSVFELPVGTGKALMAQCRAGREQDRRRLGGELHRHRAGRLPVHGGDVRRRQRRWHHRPARPGGTGLVQHAQPAAAMSIDSRNAACNTSSSAFVNLPAGSTALRIGRAATR